MSWRKSWSKQNLHPESTKRRLTPGQRSVWDDCLDLAEMAQITGSLCVAEGVQYTTAQLSAIFKTPEPLIVESLKLFRSLKMLTQDGYIAKWKKYQNEYQRQKGYRVKLQQKVTSKSTTKGTPPEYRVQNTDADTNKQVVVEQPHQTLINRFLELQGTERHTLTPEQVSGAYKRHSRSALALIREAGGLDHAVAALEWGGPHFNRLERTWTLDTIAKHLPTFARCGRNAQLAQQHGLTPSQVSYAQKLADWLTAANGRGGGVPARPQAGVSHDGAAT